MHVHECGVSPWRIDFPLVLSIADEVRSIGLDIRKQKKSAVWRTKEDGSYVSNLDFETGERLKACLSRHSPHIPLVHEEDQAHYELIAGTNDLWIADPIDHSEGLRNDKETYAISAGLRASGETAAGIVYLPELDECFAAFRGAGIMTYSSNWSWEPYKPARQEHQLISISQSSSHIVRERNKHLLTILKQRPVILDTRNKPSVYGFMEVVRKKSSAFISMSRMKLWDAIAGYAMLRELGGVVKYMSGAALSLNALETNASNDPLVFADSPETYLWIREMFGFRESLLPGTLM